MSLTKHWCLNKSCGFEETSHKIRDGWKCPKCNGPMSNIVVKKGKSEEGKQFEFKPADITFVAGNREVLVLKSNGDILVKGELVENNKEVVVGLKEFLKLAREDKE